MGLNKLGRAIKATGAMTVWKDGDGVSFTWRWWHPVTWVLTPIVIILAIILVGAIQSWEDRYRMGFGLSPYWKKRRNKREFI